MIYRRLDQIAFMTATVVNPGIHLFALVVSIKFLQPEDLGVLTNCALIPAYLSFAHLGVFTGLARQLPLNLGKGADDEAGWLEAASASLAWLQGGLLTLMVTGLALAWFVTGRGVLAGAALAATALLVLQNFVSTHVDVALRGRNDFKRLAQVLWLNHAISLATIILIWKLGAWGAVARIAIIGVFAIGVRLLLGTIPLRFKPDWERWKSLVRVGFPLMLSGALFNLLMVSDRSVVAILMDPTAVGLFALSGMLLQGLQVLPQSLSMILFPKMARDYGEHHDLRRLRPYIIQNLLFNLVTLLPLCALLYFGLEPLVERWFPSYRDGIEPAKIASLSACFWVYLGTGSVFGVSGHMRPYLTALFGAIAAVWLLGFVAIQLGHGLAGAAWARLIGTAGIAVFTIISALMLTRRNRAALPPQPETLVAP